MISALAFARMPLDHLPEPPLLGPEHAEQTTLADCSRVGRVGFRGRWAPVWLAAHGYRLPERPNQALWQDDGSLVVRLSASEFLLLGALADGGVRMRQEEADWQLGEQACYLLPRQDTHAWLALAGPHAHAVLAKLCGVNLSPAAFAPGCVAQTSVARSNAIVINAGLSGETRFWLLMDSTTACYFWGALQDAMVEFAGQTVRIL
ncbi:sarcosine oxidase [Gibbsiella greigii]